MDTHPGHNALDRTHLHLQPRDYAAEPARFGTVPHLEFKVPAGGTKTAMRAAVVQHQLAVQWRRRYPRSGAALGRRWAFSRQTLSRTLLGKRWAGHVVMSALLQALSAESPS